MDPASGDTNLSSQTQPEPVSEPGAGVVEDTGGVNTLQEPFSVVLNIQLLITLFGTVFLIL